MAAPAAVSATTVTGMPAATSSQAVRRAPWSRGRVSDASTWTGSPAAALA
jgi:hypothetical protein